MNGSPTGRQWCLLFHPITWLDACEWPNQTVDAWTQLPQELDHLFAEFTEFQLLDDSDILQEIWKKATVVEGEDCTYYRIDTIWHHMSTMRAVDSTYSFARLSKVAKLVLIIPHSNAQEERVFSMVRKNKTAFRPSLDPKGTLSSILTIKLANAEPVHCFEPSKELLKKAKSATREYNKKISSLCLTNTRHLIFL